MEASDNGSRGFIRFLQLFLILTLLFPNQVKANENVNSDLSHITADYLAAIQDSVLKKPTILPIPYVPPLPPPSNKANQTTRNACYCLAWAKARAGIGVSAYAARYHPINSAVPAAWGLVLTYESGLGHAAYYVLDHTGEWLVLEEANYVRCTVTVGRRLHISDPRIRGYYNK